MTGINCNGGGARRCDGGADFVIVMLIGRSFSFFSLAAAGSSFYVRTILLSGSLFQFLGG